MNLLSIVLFDFEWCFMNLLISDGCLVIHIIVMLKEWLVETCDWQFVCFFRWWLRLKHTDMICRCIYRFHWSAVIKITSNLCTHIPWSNRSAPECLHILGYWQSSSDAELFHFPLWIALSCKRLKVTLIQWSPTLPLKDSNFSIGCFACSEMTRVEYWFDCPYEGLWLSFKETNF